MLFFQFYLEKKNTQENIYINIQCNSSKETSKFSFEGSYYLFQILTMTVGARWPNGLRIGQSGFEPWPGWLSSVLGQDTLFS